MLQSVQHDGYQVTADSAGDSALALSKSDARSRSGLVISNATPRSQDRLYTARRAFSLVPLIVFLLSLDLFMNLAQSSLYGISHALLQALAVSLASSLVCIAAYGFYRYLLDRSFGL